MIKPLDGIRITSTAINLPGPIAASRLSEMGATITKVEPPDGDPMSMYVPAWYKVLTQGQRLRTLNLKEQNDRAELDELLAESDVFLTSHRPRGLARLGLSWDEVHAKYPRLCYVAIVGYPPPHQDLAGHDLTYQAHIGLLQPPHMPRALIADLAGAERAVSAALTLLYARERTGEAGYQEIALSDAAESMAQPLRYGLTRPGGGLGGGLPSYRIYAAKVGYVALAALEPHFWVMLETALERGPLDEASLTTIFLEKPAAEWEAWGETLGIPIAAVRED